MGPNIRPDLVIHKIADFFTAILLTFPGIAARVIEPRADLRRSENYPYLVESLFLRSRWWVNALGEPDNIHSPLMIIPVPATRAALASNRKS